MCRASPRPQSCAFVHGYELRRHTVRVTQLLNVLRRVRKVAKSVCYLRMEQVRSLRTDIHGILYFSILQKPVEKFQVWVEAHKKAATLPQDLSTFLTVSH